MIDSITRSFCLRHYVQNGLSYLGEETQPKLCLKRCQANSGFRSLGTNKHQLLHRIQSVRAFTKLAITAVDTQDTSDIEVEADLH